jgi:hypothetical protein
MVACSGVETRLIDCPANPLGENSCVHDEDAGVRCRPGRRTYVHMHAIYNLRVGAILFKEQNSS